MMKNVTFSMADTRCRICRHIYFSRVSSVNLLIQSPVCSYNADVSKWPRMCGDLLRNKFTPIEGLLAAYRAQGEK